MFKLVGREAVNMVAISSFRPLAESQDIATNQIRAKRSWDRVFDDIIYFGELEPELASDRTTFISYDGFPFIALLARTASMCDELVCLINADIVVGPHLKRTVQEALNRGALAITSWRYQFEPWDEELTNVKIVDQGLDFFATYPHIWKRVSDEIPQHYRIGHSAWDSWLLAFFHANCRRSFFDITARQCIFHPRHGERHPPHHIELVHDHYTNRIGFPSLRL